MVHHILDPTAPINHILAGHFIPLTPPLGQLCCDEPVETIDWLSLSLRWHIAYIVAASPNPQPRNDVLYKDSVYHSSRALSRPSNTKPLKKQTENKRKTEAKSCHALSSSQMTILPLMPLEASIICLFLSSVVDCAVGFKCLDFQSTAHPKVTHSPVVSWSVSWWNIYINLQYLSCTVSKVLLQPAEASLIPVRSLSVPMMGCAVSVEIGDASPWWCWLPLAKWSGRSSFPFWTQVLITCCTVVDMYVQSHPISLGTVHEPSSTTIKFLTTQQPDKRENQD